MKKAIFSHTLFSFPVRSAFSMLLRIGCFLGLLLLCFSGCGALSILFYFWVRGYFYSLDLQMFLLPRPPPSPHSQLSTEKKKKKKRYILGLTRLKDTLYKRKQRLLFVPMHLFGCGHRNIFRQQQFALCFFSKIRTIQNNGCC